MPDAVVVSVLDESIDFIESFNTKKIVDKFFRGINSAFEDTIYLVFEFILLIATAANEILAISSAALLLPRSKKRQDRKA